MNQLPRLVALLKEYSGPHQALLTNNFTTPLEVNLSYFLSFPFLIHLPSPPQELVKDFANFLELVETTIDLDMVEHHEFVIKPSFDDELARKLP